MKRRFNVYQRIPTVMTTKEKVIILNRRESIKEFDEVVTVITENYEVLDIFCAGTKKPTSKNKHSLNELSISEFEYFKTNNPDKMSKLMRGKITKKPTLDAHSLEMLLAFSEKIHSQVKNHKLRNTYLFYNRILSFEKTLGPTDYARLLTSLYVDMVKKPVINSCAVCKTKHNIRSFSLLKDGLLCDEHVDEDDPDLPGRILTDIVNLFAIDNKSWITYVANADSLRVINKMIVGHLRNIEGIFI